MVYYRSSVTPSTSEQSYKKVTKYKKDEVLSQIILHSNKSLYLPDNLNIFNYLSVKNAQNSPVPISSFF